MLTRSNDFPADPAFGDLFPRLAPDAMLAVLCDHAAVEGAECRVLEALYDPGRQIRLAYGVGPAGFDSRRVWPDGAVFALHYPVRPPMSRRGEVVCLGEYDVELYHFPNDRRLRGMRKFAGRDSAARIWQSWMDADEPGLSLDPDSLRRSLLRYVPEQKWIIQLHGRCTEPGASTDVKRAVAVRFSSLETCQAIVRRARDLRRALRDVEGAFRFQKPIALDEDHGVLAMRWVWGDRLIDLLRAHDARTVMGRVACGLHALHTTPIEHLQELNPYQRITGLRHVTDDLCTACPQRAVDINRIVSAALTSVPPANGSRATLHNDFHWDQIRGRVERLTLLDLERCQIGDPLIDVATFIAELNMLPHRPDTGVSADEARQWIKAFSTAWEDVGEDTIDQPRFRWYAAGATMSLGRAMMRHLRRGWPEILGHCLEQSTRLLHHSCDEVST